MEIAEFERVKSKATVDLDAYQLYQRATALQRYDRRFDEAYDLYCAAKQMRSIGRAEAELS